MLRERLIVIIFLIPALIFLVAAGGWLYSLLVALILGLAAWEYGYIFDQGGIASSPLLIVAGTVLLALARASGGFPLSAGVLAGLVLAAMVWAVIAYERGHPHPATLFVVTVGGFVYLGWMGSYLISLRALPSGKWWTLLALAAIWLADAFAYLIGRQFGRHPLAPRASPKKTWEGYLGGVPVAVLLCVFFTYLFRFVDPNLSPTVGLVLSLAVTLLAPLGDLGESMLKRQFGLKDSGNLLPGHGGIFDRIDSWLWAGVLGYYVVLWLA